MFPRNPIRSPSPDSAPYPLLNHFRKANTGSSSSHVCQVHEPEHTPSLTTDTSTVDEEAVNFRGEPGFGIFDSGATGPVISAYELKNLRAEEPEAFSEIDESRRKVMGFGGGTQTFSLGVCTQSPTRGPMAHKPIERDVSNNTQSNRPDKTPSTHTHCLGP